MNLPFDARFSFHLQVRDLIADGIANEDYVEGGTIPGALILSKEFQVNEQTVRRAVSDLVAMGYLRVIRGKGTYVVEGARDMVRESSRGILEHYDIKKMVRTARMIRLKQPEMLKLIKAEYEKQIAEEG
jgi:DNA-binding GntR family transcriptional regulator